MKTDTASASRKLTMATSWIIGRTSAFVSHVKKKSLKSSVVVVLHSAR
ncbi:hypothetical protein EMGBS4_02250 [Acidimicrobiaceae bacterium]|nr:hypothetical protein EMGBS4_02250 [Acidimicrobiaceae bacterium]